MTPPKLILPPFVGCICRKDECLIPYGLCHCGCGGKTAFPRDNDIKHGRFFGVPVEFIRGHHGKIRPIIEEAMPFKIDGVYCRLIPLTKGLYTIVDVDNYERFSKNKYVAQQTRYPGKFYAARAYKIGKKHFYIYMHQEVLDLPDNDKRIPDHINKNSLDNRRSNLRPATYIQNGMNSGLRKNNTSGFKGVSWDKRKGKWKAAIMHNRKTKFLGYFDTPEEGHAAYCKAAVELVGEFACFG